MEIVFNDTVEAFRGNGRVESVVTGSGREVKVDLVAFGVDPDLGFQHSRLG